MQGEEGKAKPLDGALSVAMNRLVSFVCISIVGRVDRGPWLHWTDCWEDVMASKGIRGLDTMHWTGEERHEYVVEPCGQLQQGQ